jgi:hypothetical protein
MSFYQTGSGAWLRRKTSQGELVTDNKPGAPIPLPAEAAKCGESLSRGGPEPAWPHPQVEYRVFT